MTARGLWPYGLYGVTPDWDDLARLEEAVRAAARGGMRALQWRHKTCPENNKHRFASRLRDVCAELGVVFIINDHWRLALDCQADGVHLGRDDEHPQVVRDQVGDGLIIGTSCYGDLARATSMLALDVDYIAFGAMFTSGTKPHAPGAPLSVLTEAQALVLARKPSVRVVAIGGITAQNAGSVVAAGAQSLAVVGGLFLADDIELTARSICQAWGPKAPAN
jgi:thiamine-phosphate pyrophosphorylase